MATYFSILSWEIPWTEEPGWPQFMGSQSQTQLSNCTTNGCLSIHVWGQLGLWGRGYVSIPSS